MSPTRREFLSQSLATGAILAASRNVRAETQGETSAAKTKSPKKILVLGGTGFLGPAIVEAASKRGHVLTLFNRGKTRPGLFPDVEKIRGDRDPKKDEGLKGLEGHKWDAVIDDSGYYPRMVRASAELLAPNVGHYIYISSISCYAKNETIGADEKAELAVLADPTVETMGKDYENYGGLKVLCEKAAEAALPGRVANVRPGYIVGPDDPTGRFTYWPVRFDRGGDVLVPGSADDPLQIIDVRDLAEWLVMCVEKKTVGLFNACGPEKKLAWGRAIEACQKAAGKPSKLHWVAPEDLAKQAELGELPIWAAATGETAGFHTWSNARAVAAGLNFRDIDAIAADTLRWWKSLADDDKRKHLAGPDADKETAALRALGRIS